MSSRARLLAWGLALAAVHGIVAPPRAGAQPPPAAGEQKPLKDTLTGDARADFDAALQLYDNRDYVGAALKFQRAYDASKDPRLLFNIADCEIYNHHYAKAVGLLQRFLSEGVALTEKQRTGANDVLRNVERFTTRLRVNASEAGADVFVDDEKVGTSPLAQPVVVDIGVRKIRVKKDGFREVVKDVPVGGAGEVTVEAKLEHEVHEGKVTIHAPAGAVITLDGKPLGEGNWQGSVASGGHTLRVSAPKMHPYQSEITVQDNEQRTIDVVLEAIVDAPVFVPEDVWRGALGGMELGVRTGGGAILRSDSPGVIPLWVDIGVRLGRPTFLGIYGQLGAVNASSKCGTDLHGATPASPADIDVRYAMQSCSYFKAGLELLIHPVPRSRWVDFWFGFDGGFQLLSVEAKIFDPLAGGTPTSDKNAFPGIAIGGQLGVDLHPIAGYQRLAVGPFGAYAFVLIGGDLSKQFGPGSNTNNPLKPNNSSQENKKNSQYGNLLIGVRSAILF